MKRVVAGVLSVAAGVVLGGCAQGGPAASTGTRNSPSATASSSIAPRDLTPQLLTVADLAAGWAVDNNSPDSTASTPPCIKNFKRKIKATSRAEARFVKGTDIPIFDEELSYYGTSERAAAVYDAGVAAFNSCKDLSFTSGGTKYTVSIGAMSFPRIGKRSSAWQLTVTVQGVTAGFDAVVSQKGSELNFTVYGDVGTPSLDTVAPMVKAAVAKMPNS